MPSFRREPAPGELSDVIRWFWIAQWDLTPGRSSRQVVLPFPASNLVVNAGGVTLVGPTTTASERDLRGRGWVVGALLRPAGLAQLSTNPQELRDREVPFEARLFQRAVAAAMQEKPAATPRAIQVYCAWAARRCATLGREGRLANRMEDLIASDRAITRVGHVADQLGMSVRGVQRLAKRFVGLAPLTIIRRYRLQEAADRLRTDRLTTIAQVAADLGYSDHAHLSADFRQVFGFSPRSYQSETR